jgi:ABC-type transport system involved in Fe-S cluster assembly fused permease/ATPase subunit
MQIKFVPNAQSASASPLRKLAALIVTVAVVALAVMFSAVLLVVIVILGTMVWAWLWWKTRALRKHMRDLQAQARERAESASNDAVFEGEVIRVVEPNEVK